jgi:hypothetical protein
MIETISGESKQFHFVGEAKLNSTSCTAAAARAVEPREINSIPPEPSARTQASTLMRLSGESASFQIDKSGSTR